MASKNYDAVCVYEVFDVVSGFDVEEYIPDEPDWEFDTIEEFNEWIKGTFYIEEDREDEIWDGNKLLNIYVIDNEKYISDGVKYGYITLYEPYETDF